MPHYTALVTMLAILFYAYTSVNVGGARVKLGVPAPATTGNPDFERLFRVQMNTLEWMPIFLPLLWICAFYVGDAWAAALGVVWVGGRIAYLVGYAASAEKRGPGFGVQALACGALLVADVVAVIARLIHGA